MLTTIASLYLEKAKNTLSVQITKEDDGTYAHIQVQNNKDEVTVGVVLWEKGISEFIEDLRFGRDVHFFCEETYREFLTVQNFGDDNIYINITSTDPDHYTASARLNEEEYSNFYNFLLLAEKTFK